MDADERVRKRRTRAESIALGSGCLRPQGVGTMVGGVMDEPAPENEPRRLVHHTPLRRWSPISKAERRETRRFVEKLVEFPYLTAGTVALLVWFYLVQLAFDWPIALLFPDTSGLSADLAMNAIGHRMGWLDPELVREERLGG